MGTPTFFGSRAKLARADELSDALYGYTARTVGLLQPGDAVSLRTQLDTNTWEYRVWVDAVDPIASAKLGVFVGDIVHNIRSALDHVAWQLVMHGGVQLSESQARKVMFPITDSEPEFKSQTPKSLPGVRPEEMTAVERFQPYNRLDSFLHFKNGAPLARLRELSRHDKHRVITPVLVVPARLPTFIYRDTRYISHIVDDGPIKLDTPFLRITVEPIGDQPSVEMKGQMAFEIAFEDGAFVAIELGHASNEAHKLITHLQRIVEAA